jgi:hypothetical protein
MAADGGRALWNNATRRLRFATPLRYNAGNLTPYGILFTLMRRIRQ